MIAFVFAASRHGKTVAVAAAAAKPVEPTVVAFRPLPTPTRHPPWEPEVVIVDDLGPPTSRREWRGS